MFGILRAVLFKNVYLGIPLFMAEPVMIFCLTVVVKHGFRPMYREMYKGKRWSSP